VNVEKNLALVQQKIAASLERAGRTESVKLVAVTKTVEVPVIEEALRAGITAIGENIVQEAARKKELVKKRAEWHMIGHLQSNKARKAAETFDWVQSVDSLKIARKLDNACGELGKTMNVLVQVNIAEEETKYGTGMGDIEKLVGEVKNMKNINLKGLMVIAPYFEDPEAARPVFKQGRELKDKLGLEMLSMGMTNDYEVAVEEGANIVRIGTAIFGPRGE
jgi:pyridoxal phosphate enzyme (YggS family)